MALEIADGDFVLFMDSNDYLEQNAIEILHEAITPDECMFVCGNYIEKEYGGTRLTKFSSQPITEVFTPREVLSKLLVPLLNKGQLRKMILLCISYRLYSLAEQMNQKKRKKAIQQQR